MQDATTIGDNAMPTYRRRDNGNTFTKRVHGR
jgi:hypothetical protein